jgi:hypothetical protein
MYRRAGRRPTSALALILAVVSGLIMLATRWGPVDVAAAPTTTVAPSTTAAGATTTAAATSTTSPGPTTTAVPTTTEAGPPPLNSRRVASAVDIEKVRPTSMPFRTMGIATAVLIAGLAVAGFVYGKVRSRPPTPAATRPAAADSMPGGVDATPSGVPSAGMMPPPTPLPPPQRPTEAVSDWAPPTV